MSSRPGSGGNPTLEELLEAGRTSVSYIHLDEEESPMKKTILVFGLPGRQASSVCSALVGNPLFNVRGVFSKDSPATATFQAMGVETEIMEITDKGPISMLKLNHIFRDVYGVFIVTNDTEPILAMRREMEFGMKLAEMCERVRIKHIVYSAVDFVYRITGTRCSRYDGKGEVEYRMKGMGVPLTVLKLPLSYEYLVNTFIPSHQGHDLVFTGITEPNLEFDVMNFADIGPVVKLIFERPNIFIGKTIGLTVDRVDLNRFMDTIEEAFKDAKIGWRYEKLGLREYQKDKKNNRELATLLDFHCNYAPLRDVKTTLALNPSTQSFPQYVASNRERIRKLFKVP